MDDNTDTVTVRDRPTVPSEPSHHWDLNRHTLRARLLNPLLVVLLGSAIVLGFGLIGHASAQEYITSGQHSGNGHNGVTFLVTHGLDYTPAAANWRPLAGDAQMRVTNSGSALCSRHRMYQQDWTLVSNLNWAGTPFPFTNDGFWHYDIYIYPEPARLWALRSWWQINDRFLTDGTCDYGGGAGITKASLTAFHQGETIPSP